MLHLCGAHTRNNIQTTVKVPCFTWPMPHETEVTHTRQAHLNSELCVALGSKASSCTPAELVHQWKFAEASPVMQELDDTACTETFYAKDSRGYVFSMMIGSRSCVGSRQELMCKMLWRGGI
eukprot:1690740-Amphidinium_carterae.1